jgi:hypothetical protein
MTSPLFPTRLKKMASRPERMGLRIEARLLSEDLDDSDLKRKQRKSDFFARKRGTDQSKEPSSHSELYLRVESTEIS